MSKSHIQIHPNAKSKHDNKSQNLKKLDKLAQKYSWLVIGVFAVSTVVVLGLVVNEIRGNVGQAALDLAGYNSWKTTYGLNASANDANHNLSGDGVTNYNKYTLSQNLSNVFDGSVILDTAQTSSGSTTSTSTSSTSGAIPIVVGSGTVANKTLDASAPPISANSTTGSSKSTTPAAGTSLTAANLNPNGPALSNPTPSTGSTAINGSSSGKVATSTGGTTITNPSNNGASTAIPLPIPGSSSSGIVASTTSSSSASTNSSSGGTTGATTSTGGKVATSGTSAEANSTSASKTSGISAVSGAKTVTVRSGGEINFIIFALGLISLFTGGYLLKNKFTKNLLAVHQGEKSGKS